MRTTAATSSSTEAARLGTTSTTTAASAKTRLRRHVRMASPMTEPGAKQDACYAEVRERTTAAQLPRTGLSLMPLGSASRAACVDLAMTPCAQCRGIWRGEHDDHA